MRRLVERPVDERLGYVLTIDVEERADGGPA